MEDLETKIINKGERRTSKKAGLARGAHAYTPGLRMQQGVDLAKRRTMWIGRKLARLTIPPHPRLQVLSRRMRNPTVTVCERHYFSSLPAHNNLENFAVPDNTQEALISNQSESNAADESTSDQWRSTASATAKLFLHGVRESADAFGPLKSVVGGLCFILENCEVQSSSHLHSP